MSEAKTPPAAIKAGKTAADLNVKPVFLESEIEVDPIYTAEDIADSGAKNEMPGE